MDIGGLGGGIQTTAEDKIKFGAHAETFQTFMIIEFYLLLFWPSFNRGSSLGDIKQSRTYKTDQYTVRQAVVGCPARAFWRTEAQTDGRLDAY